MPLQKGAPLMYCGIIVLEPQVLDLIPPSPPWSIMSGLIGPMVCDDLPIMGYVHTGLMHTVDDLATYERVRKEFGSKPPNLKFLKD